MIIECPKCKKEYDTEYDKCQHCGYVMPEDDIPQNDLETFFEEAEEHCIGWKTEGDD